jgi:hypothetical protein
MNTLQNLSNEKLSLTALLLDLDESITKAQAAVEASFSSSANTDELSLNLSMLQAKRFSLLNALKTNDQAIKQAHADVEAEEAAKVIATRHKAVEDALKANEAITILCKKLSSQFEIFTSNVATARANSSELQVQPRIHLGKLALKVNQIGGLTGAAVLPLLNLDDADKIKSKVL